MTVKFVLSTIFYGLSFITVLKLVQAKREVDAECKYRPAEFTNILNCCPIPDFSFGSNELQCQNKLLQRRNKLPFVCQIHCVFENTNITTSDNKFDLKETRTRLQAAMSNPAHAEAYYKSFEECAYYAKDIRDFAALMPGQQRKRGTCSLVGLFYWRCAHKMLLKYCPVSEWQNTESCEISKQFVEKCANRIYANTPKLANK